MLMKFKPVVNFINILCRVFTGADPKSVKNSVKLSNIFALLGSACMKAARKPVGEINNQPGGKRVARANRLAKDSPFSFANSETA
jgi:hypothetical protein